ncbi:MAG: DEAD/DEAH box helicase [Acidimicrobiales bacterium]
MGIEPQIKKLNRGIDVLVATPGRLEDLIARRAVTLADAAIVVVDEADRMADMGFMPVVKRLLDQTPAQRQTVLYSATLDGDVGTLISRYQRNPVRHEVGPASPDLKAMEHYFWELPRNDRVPLCASVIATFGPTIVFTRTRHGADRLGKQLGRLGVKAVAIHGNRSQAQRTRALDDFSRGRAHALVATDVAARGIHVDGVECVVHFDPVDEDSAYVHRSGRTARAGARGKVISFVDPGQTRLVRAMMRRLDLPQDITRPPEVEGGPLPELPPDDADAGVGADAAPARRSSSRPGRGGKPRTRRTGGKGRQAGTARATSTGSASNPRNAGGKKTSGTRRRQEIASRQEHGRHPRAARDRRAAARNRPARVPEALPVAVAADGARPGRADPDPSALEERSGALQRARVLEHEDVPSLEHLERRTGYRVREPLGVLERGNAVVPSGTDERRCGDAGQAPGGIVASAGFELSEEPLLRLGRALDELTGAEHRGDPFQAGDVLPGLVAGVEQLHRRVGPVLGRQHLQLVQGIRRGVAPRRGAVQDEPLHEIAMADRDVLGDHAAERRAHHRATVPPQLGAERRGVVGEVRHGRRVVAERGTAEPPLVVVQAEEVGVQPVRCRGGVAEVAAAARDVEQGRPGAVPLVVHGQVAHRDERHGADPRRAGDSSSRLCSAPRPAGGRCARARSRPPETAPGRGSGGTGEVSPRRRRPIVT